MSGRRTKPAADTPSSSFSDLPPALQHIRHTTRDPGGSIFAVLRTKITGSRPVWLGHTVFGFCAAHDKSEPAREDASPPTAVQTSHQNSVVSQNSDAPVQRRATQPRPCARADTTRPATANYPPVRKERLSRGFPSKEPPQQFHHTTICTSHHHIILYYIARTDRPDGRRVTRHLENRSQS